MSRFAHRLRSLAGLAAALALGVGLSWALLGRARREAALEEARRKEVVSLLALADLASRAWGTPDAPARALAAWQEGRGGVSARIVASQGARLEASTFPGDQGDRAAPRRLSRDEKAIYDRVQRLRGAMTGNREGASSKPEIEIEAAPGGRLDLATPIVVAGEPVGMVEVRSAPLREAPPAPGGFALAAMLLPLLAFALGAFPLGERRWTLCGLAAACLAGGLLVHGAHALGTLEADQRAGQGAVAGHLSAEAGRTGAALAALGLPPAAPLSPAGWDADPYRKPLGLLSGDRAADERALAARVAAGAAEARRALWAVGAVSLLLLLFVGLGGAERAGRAIRVHRQAYTYILPAMVGMLVLVFFPFFYGIAISFTDQNIYNTARPLSEIWVGLRNYGDILGDWGMAKRAADGSLVFNYLNFYWTLLFTVVWTVTNVAFGVTMGLLLALILNREIALRPVYRVLLILPWAVPNYITALVWKGMFHQQFGVVNQLVQLFGGQPVSWFDSPASSYFTALATNGWLSFPFMMVVSLGALQSIPGELYEAARVDGANRWQQFRAITLPSLKPALVPAVILSVVWTFNMFNIIYLVTAGEPGSSTEILVTQAYKYAFERYRYGYAAAYSTIIFGILLVYSTVQNRLSRATEAA